MKTYPYFDPKTKKYPYPEDTDCHYLHVKKDNGLVFDDKYPYVDKSKKMRNKQGWTRFLLKTIVFPMTYIRLGLKVRGKENLTKYKDIINNGAVTVSNHVHMWDYLAIQATLKRKMNVIVWDKNIRGEMSGMIRSVGGIPIPSEGIKGTMAFNDAVNNLLTQDHGLLQVYAEGSMWEYYAPIRPFKVGAAYFAIKADKPIVPLAFSYRRPNWFRKLFGQIAVFNINIGEPIYPNKELSVREAEIDLTMRVHDEICRLAGINPEDNLYQPIYHNDTRIDYYTDKYGIGYKGSH